MSHSVPSTLSARERAVIIVLDRIILGSLRHWLLILNLLWGIYVITPWLAPVFMQTGHKTGAYILYAFYSTQCHQLPQRSFFLFGPKFTYSLAEVQADWQVTHNPLILRQFIGNPHLGWKVAWSDRMVSMFTMIFIGGLLYTLIRKRLRPLLGWGFAALTLPMVIDGGTHLISDLAGIGQGFRDSNAWLVRLTSNSLPAWFYAGETLGSFNSWMRLLTGVFFGIGVVWFAYPYIERFARDTCNDLEAKLRRAEAIA